MGRYPLSTAPFTLLGETNDDAYFASDVLNGPNILLQYLRSHFPRVEALYEDS